MTRAHTTVDDNVGSVPTSLVALIASDDERPLSLAEGYLDAFVPLVHAVRAKGARMLTDLKGWLTRGTNGRRCAPTSWI
jgi:hypothetical protein